MATHGLFARAGGRWRLGAAAALALGHQACAHDERVPPSSPPTVANPVAGAEPLADGRQGSPYLLADPLLGRGHHGGEGSPLVLGRDVLGLVVEGARVVARGGRASALRVSDPPLTRGIAVPGHLGGGFLFLGAPSSRREGAGRGLYHAERFDGPLRPLASVGEVELVAFGPRGALLRDAGGDIWTLNLVTGAPEEPSPGGAVDVVALADGRALALTETGGLLISTDGGGHWWSPKGGPLVTSPEELRVVEGELWALVSSSGVSTSSASGPGAYRLEPGGRLAAFDQGPTAASVEVRPRDPRWHGDEPPLRRALRAGVPLGDGTALVVEGGAVMRVSLATGQLAQVAPARLPPDAPCEVARVEGEILAVCVKPAGGSLVASRLLDEGGPHIEQVFGAPGTFYGGDEGGLVFGGPCAGARASRVVACLRTAGAAWQEVDLEAALSTDGGTPLEITRWVPRIAGGEPTVWGLVAGSMSGGTLRMVDGRTGEIRALSLEGLSPAARSSLADARARGGTRDGSHLVDRGWSFTGVGTLRAWSDGGAWEISMEGGTVSPSPFTFDHVATFGALAFARGRDGRAFQTTDHGASWTEVAGPPGRRLSPEGARFCSAVGCELAGWYRVGWPSDAPGPAESVETVGVPPRRVPPVPTLRCTPTGEPRLVTLPRSDRSPEDLGLGATRLILPPESGDVEDVRSLHGRVPDGPVRDADVPEDPDYPAARLVLHGRGLHNLDADTPRYRAELAALRRAATFVAPFDPTGSVRRVGLGAGDVAASLRGTGLRPTDVWGPDLFTPTAVVPLTPSDPTAPGDLLMSTEGNVVAVLRGRPRYGVLGARDGDRKLLSGVAMGEGEWAFLEEGDGGGGVVSRLGPSGVAELFDVPPLPQGVAYPVNADALGIGPRGELAVIRTRSGPSPPSELAPALALTRGGEVVPLAPWRTLTPADDGACRGGAGYRVTVVASAPWLQVVGGPRPRDDTPMLARVKWSEERVCLEAVEIRVEDQRVTIRQRDGDAPTAPGVPSLQNVETWMVARLAGSPQAARIGVVPGVESRTPFACTLSGSPPPPPPP